MVVDLISNEIDDWIVPFMSAYVDVRPELEVEDVKFAMLFISRRSRYRQGRPSHLTFSHRPNRSIVLLQQAADLPREDWTRMDMPQTSSRQSKSSFSPMEG